MTPTILGDKAADSADRAAGTLVQSFGEFNGAAARLMFPPEGYSKADFIGLTTDFQIASLRLWLAAVEAPVRMIAGVSLPPIPDVAAALSPAPVMKKPSPPKASASKPAKLKPEAVAKPAASRPTSPVAKKPTTPSSNAASTVVPFRRAEAPKPQESVPLEAKGKTTGVPKAKSPAPSPAPAKLASVQSTPAKPVAKPVVAPAVAAKPPGKPMAAKPVAAKPVAAKTAPAKPVAIKAEPPKAAPPKPQPAAKVVDPAGDFDDASVAAAAPAFLAAPEGKADDLLVIKGIGPKLNQLLHDLGIWHYRQIANWTPGEIAWINAKLDFKGRVQRERWVMQARELAGKSAA